MPPNRTRSPARLLAPAALLALALAVSLIVLGSGGPDKDSEKSPTATERSRTATGGTRASRRRAERRSTYTVRPGDTLVKIAERSGVEVETLQELNPAIDPQALVTGQKIKLRE